MKVRFHLLLNIIFIHMFDLQGRIAKNSVTYSLFIKKTKHERLITESLYRVLIMMEKILEQGSSEL